MQKTIALKLSPLEAGSHDIVKASIADALSVEEGEVCGFYPLKKSIDARGRQIWVNLTLNVFVNEPFIKREVARVGFRDVSQRGEQVIIVGAGPAGLFAALRLLELGIRPLIIERGKDVRERRRDLALLNRQGIVNPNSNYCFGEGGAGTYSDGKLYSRSNKRGDIGRILQLFYQFGAEENILYEAHPHIGTNKLPHIIAQMRETIVAHGGGYLFGSQVVDFIIEKDTIKGVVLQNGDIHRGVATVLATGHSSRDIFGLLYKKGILIEPKPFALGVRMEHPQQIVNAIQYHSLELEQPLPPASYSLVEQAQGRGVFSFCMCPGGIIAPASTAPGEVVVNGWSPSKRNNPFANSGWVVSVDANDAVGYLKQYPDLAEKHLQELENHIKDIDARHPLALLYFQALVERRCFEAGGGGLRAPAQRLVDFCTHRVSATLPENSYHPGAQSVDLSGTLPPFVANALREGLVMAAKKMRDRRSGLGLYTNEALLVATESRTSSPVRIPRDKDSLQHPQIARLYPCGEGAGYAGGIVSAAMDGENVADKVALSIFN